MLLGYKLAFKGRFSRKQRASNIWYMHGKVPLNTLSVKLDYFWPDRETPVHPASRPQPPCTAPPRYGATG